MIVIVLINRVECESLRRQFDNDELGKLLCHSYVEGTLDSCECEIHVEEVIDIPIHFNQEVDYGHKHSHRLTKRAGNERGREEAEPSNANL